MISRYELQGIVWVDVESPTPDEIADLVQEFSLGPLIAEELMGPTLKPHVDLYPQFAYAVLHFPAIRHTHGITVAQEVDMIVGREFIVTVHYEPVTAIIDFSRSFEATQLLRRVTGKFHSGHVLFEIVERLYEGVENELESIEDNIVGIEKAIFSGKEREMVTAISAVSRELLIHKRTLGTHRETLESLEQAGTTLFGEQFRNYLRGITALHFRIFNKASGYIDTITDLRSTNDSLLSTRQNEIMKNLTIMTFLTAPLAVMVNLFSMNAIDTPILGKPNDFWIVVFIMLGFAILMFVFFKARRWF
jgi:magnesium transporter